MLRISHLLPFLPLSLSVLLTPTDSDLPPIALISSTPPSTLQAECLRASYYGTYGGSASTRESIFFPSDECLEEGDALMGLDGGAIVPLLFGNEDGTLVWVGQAGVDGWKSRESPRESWNGIQDKISSLALNSQQDQATFSSPNTESAITLVHASPHSLLLHVPDAYMAILDTLLPPHLVPVALPFSPLPLSYDEPSPWPAVSPHILKNLANITKHLNFSPKIDSIVTNGMNLDKIRRHVRWLTGEAPSGIESRHSFTPGARVAAEYIKSKVEESGASCHFHHFLPSFSPNVICTYPSLQNSSEMVLLSAHYDSRGSFGFTRAPGGDDDGSGSGYLLGLTEAIKSEEIKFEKRVVVAFFAGEEQGLYGSNAYAKLLKGNNATISLMLHADMIGYHAPGEPMQLALPEWIGTLEASHLIGNISHLYSPELVVGTTPACCSDHQSFLAQGFPSTAVFERNGNILDPMYHNSGDLTQRDGYDFEQIVAIGRVMLAAVLTVAGYRIEH